MLINVSNNANGKGKKFASGKVKISNQNDVKYFYVANSNQMEARNYAEVYEDFGFLPSFIMILYRSHVDQYYKTIYKEGGLTTEGGDFDIDIGNRGYVLKGNAQVWEQGFILPFVYILGQEAEWYAYE